MEVARELLMTVHSYICWQNQTYDICTHETKPFVATFKFTVEEYSILVYCPVTFRDLAGDPKGMSATRKLPSHEDGNCSGIGRWSSVVRLV